MAVHTAETETLTITIELDAEVLGTISDGDRNSIMEAAAVAAASKLAEVA